MPPSLEITTSLNEPVWNRLIVALKIPAPEVQFRPVQGQHNMKNCLGIFAPASYTITMFTGWPEFENDRLIGAMGEAGRTLLHEVRHAWQWHHDRPLFDGPVVKCEEDAIAFEDEYVNYRGIVRVQRKQHNSPFARLGATQARVRPSV